MQTIPNPDPQLFGSVSLSGILSIVVGLIGFFTVLANIQASRARAAAIKAGTAAEEAKADATQRTLLIESLTTQINYLRDLLDQQGQSIVVLREENKQLRTASENGEKVIARLEANLEELKTEMAEVRRQSQQEAENHIRELTETRQRYETRITALETELKTVIEARDAAIRQVDEQVRVLESERAVAKMNKETLTALRAELDKHVLTIETQNKVIDRLKAELAAVQHDLEQALATIARLESEKGQAVTPETPEPLPVEGTETKET